jgi:hypothetical protein
MQLENGFVVKRIAWQVIKLGEAESLFSTNRSGQQVFYRHARTALARNICLIIDYVLTIQHLSTCHCIAEQRNTSFGIYTVYVYFRAYRLISVRLQNLATNHVATAFRHAWIRSVMFQVLLRIFP